MSPASDKFPELWSRLETAVGTEFQSSLRELYQLISTDLNFPIKSIKFHSHFAVCYYDMSKMRIEVGEETPFYFLRYNKISDQKIQEIFYQIKTSLYQRNLQDIVSFLCVTGNELEISDQIKNSYLDIVVINRSNLLHILNSEYKQRALIKLISEQQGISIISPYSSTRIPIGSMFYGRKKHVQDVIKSRFDINFAIIGSRRIGKTSLLLNIKKYLDAENIFRTLFFDCYRIRTIYDFVVQIATQLDVRYAQKIQISGFYDFMKRMKAKYNKKFIFFLDEFDDLLLYDKTCQWELSRNFHALALEDVCKIIVAGYRTLYQEINNHQSPFFKYFEQLKIKELDDEAANKLILEPLSDLGIKIQDREAFSRVVMDITANHPHFIQFFCGKLIEIVNKKNLTELSIEDVKQVEALDDYYHFVVDTLIINTDEFQQLIVYEMIDLDTFNEKTILDHFQKNYNLDLSLTSIQRDCYQLELANILKREKDDYHFSYPALPKILKDNYNLPFIRQRLAKEIISRERYYAK